MSAPGRSHGRIAPRASLEPRSLMEGEEISGAWTARVLTLFPEMFPGPLGVSLLGQALKRGLWNLSAIDIRSFASDRHRTVDAPPAGGGPGMVMRADIAAAAIDEAMRGAPRDRARWPLIHLSPRGARFDQAMAKRFATCEGLTLLCGRFEGLDQRVLDARGVDEVSLGDFVMTGGEIAAMALIDATVRLIPRVLGNAASVAEESFADGLLEAPHYTKPPLWEGREIPEVLLSGHHARIAAWRAARSEELTKERRPDLWRAHLAKSGDFESAADPVDDEELSDAHTTAGKGGSEKD
ncbi:tRNA (guanosine(37)-N1)-methyltransferase TrmD [Pikeienuella piscinae]|uniref:tRNA (guanine-N(1)-)-methyltransferase n=1 Tax=Pikeienuella piscinae TaxID=2748098 RepID=A0A7L5BUS9_9RHOB|nr:tRNA (guanosine(37)-N1)-methyltransferase TrmD [Pikeienuella piscinae]QIE55432.1 tRNA (guanosine(37)-N1)-methyltransferase TrmD [Pikeienuella piscinae]